MFHLQPGSTTLLSLKARSYSRRKMSSVAGRTDTCPAERTKALFKRARFSETGVAGVLPQPKRVTRTRPMRIAMNFFTFFSLSFLLFSAEIPNLSYLPAFFSCSRFYFDVRLAVPFYRYPGGIVLYGILLRKNVIEYCVLFCFIH